MATVTIYMKAVKDGNKTQLHLRDSEGNTGIDDLTTMVNPEDNVIWKKDKDSDIEKISRIFKKPESKELFSKLPKKKWSGKWKGTIEKHAKGEEDYNIEYKVKSSGEMIVLDPKLRTTT